MEKKEILLSGSPGSSPKTSRSLSLQTETQSPWNTSTNSNAIRSWCPLMWESWDQWLRAIPRSSSALVATSRKSFYANWKRTPRNLMLQVSTWRFIWAVCFLRKEKAMSWQKNRWIVCKVVLRKLTRSRLKISEMWKRCLCLCSNSGAKLSSQMRSSSKNF